MVAAVPSSLPPSTTRPTNYARSLFHMGSAAVGVTSVALLSRGWLVAIPGAFAAYAWAMEIGRKRSPKLNDYLMRLYGPIAHPSERYRVNSATWYGTALVLLALFATKPAMFCALVVLGVADPLAAMIGRRWGTRKLRPGRSLEGTLAFFAIGSIAAAVTLIVSHGGAPAGIAAFALIAGATGAIAELYASTLDDNFTVPLAIGVVGTVVGPLVAIG